MGTCIIVPGRDRQNFYRLSKFRGFMAKNLPLFLDVAKLRLPVKMGTNMDVRFGREWVVGWLWGWGGVGVGWGGVGGSGEGIFLLSEMCRQITVFKMTTVDSHADYLDSVSK